MEFGKRYGIQLAVRNSVKGTEFIRLTLLKTANGTEFGYHYETLLTVRNGMELTQLRLRNSVNDTEFN